MSQPRRGLVICSVLETTVERVAERIAAAPRGCGLVEIRADQLHASDVGDLVRGAERDVVVTVRRPADGGAFDGSEAERRGIFDAALTAGARYVDVELGLPVAELADGDQADRVILSHHGSPCRIEALRPIARRLHDSKAGKLKLVPTAVTVDELIAVRDVLREAGTDRRMACFALGRAGAVSRIATLAWGSWATYGSAAPGAATAPGQFTASDLLELYEVGSIGTRTSYFALIGTNVFRSPSPAMHAAGYRAAGLDARYVPIELDEPVRFEKLLEQGVLPLRGFAVTMPFKGVVAARCGRLDPVAERARAVNTVLVDDDGWAGSNTDGPAAAAGIARVLPEVWPAVRVAILGAGGTARAVAAAVGAAGAEVTLYARDVARAAAATPADWRIEPWKAVETARWDVLVNATPLGSAGERVLDGSPLTGRAVVDAVYGKRQTALIAMAREQGLATIDGYELLVDQAVLQFRRLAGKPVSRDVMTHAGRTWLDANH